jgi:CRISPR-associated endonuclease/helicase Cas3
LLEHSGDVAREAEQLCDGVGLSGAWRQSLSTAGRWHDAGKAHPIWQEAAKKLGPGAPPGFVAKSASSRGRIRFARKGFRHELASALAALQHGQSDLVAFLIAAHHGKVRLSLRSLPTEPVPTREGRKDPSVRFARGVWESDVLPEVDLGGGVLVPETRLTLAYMELGFDEATGPSWAERMLSLRDAPDVGPFRLGFLEALIKCADERASARVTSGGKP